MSIWRWASMYRVRKRKAADAALPGKALESGRLRVDAQRHAIRVQLLTDELVHLLCGQKINIGQQSGLVLVIQKCNEKYCQNCKVD